VQNGDLVRFAAGRGPERAGNHLMGILVAVTQPEGFSKPIATVFWTSLNRQMQHLAEQLEAINENR